MIPGILFQQKTKISRLVKNEKGVVQKKLFDKYRIEYIAQEGDMSLENEQLEDKEGDGN